MCPSSLGNLSSSENIVPKIFKFNSFTSSGLLGPCVLIQNQKCMSFTKEMLIHSVRCKKVFYGKFYRDLNFIPYQKPNMLPECFVISSPWDHLNCFPEKYEAPTKLTMGTYVGTLWLWIWLGYLRSLFPKQYNE